jgi:hypothetical protein
MAGMARRVVDTHLDIAMMLPNVKLTPTTHAFQQSKRPRRRGSAKRTEYLAPSSYTCIPLRHAAQDPSTHSASHPGVACLRAPKLDLRGRPHAVLNTTDRRRAHRPPLPSIFLFPADSPPQPTRSSARSAYPLRICI